MNLFSKKKKLIFLIISIFTTTHTVKAQNTPPNLINYQAVAHDNSGEPLSNQTVDIIINILDGTSTVLWSEEHNGINTNNYGLISLMIGNGTNQSSSFTSIDWPAGPRFLEIEINDGFGFNSMGVHRLVSVPYALHAQTVENDQVDDADASTTNELQTISINGSDVTLSDGGGTITLPITPTADGSETIINAGTDIAITGTGTSANPYVITNSFTEVDGSTTNELISNAILNGTDLEITDAGGTQSVDLSSLGSADDQNILGSGLTGTTLTIGIESGASETVDLISLVDDADASTSNELISNAILNGTDLEITDAGGTQSVDLSSFSSTDDQNIAGSGLTGNTLTIGIESGTSETVDLSALDESVDVGVGLSVSESNGVYTIVNTGDTDDTDDITNSTTAGGDLSGTYPDPTVVHIQGIPVDATTPTGSQILVYDAAMGSWVPTDRNPDADWTINGTDMYSTVSGNVGIGTSTPDELFHVQENSGDENVALFESNNDYTAISVNSNTANEGGSIYFSQYNDAFLSYFGGNYFTSTGDTNAFVGVGDPRANNSNPELGLSVSSSDKRVDLTLYRSGIDSREFKMCYNNNTSSSQTMLISDTVYFRGGPNFSDPTEFFISGKTTSDNIIAYNGFRYENAPNTGYILQSSDNLGNATWVDPSTISTADDGDWTSGNNAGNPTIYNANDFVGIGTNNPSYPLHVESSYQYGTADFSNNANSSSAHYGVSAGASGSGSGDKRGGTFTCSNGTGTNIGIRAEASGGSSSYAGYFVGDVVMDNNLSLGTTSYNLTGNSRTLTISATDTYQSGKVASLELKGSDGAADGTTNSINFYHQYTTGVAYEAAKIETRRSGLLEQGRLVFFTADSAGSVTEKMRIDETGMVTIPNKLGIGSANTNYNLNVLGNALFSDNVHVGSSSPPYNNAKLLVWGAGWSNALNVGGSSNTQVFLVKSNGNVGIGGITPQNKLDVEGGAVIGSNYAGTNTSPSEGLLIEGNVGIGTSSPTSSTKLHTVATTTGILGHFDNFTTTGGTGIKAEVNQNNASSTGTRYGVYAAAWHGQSVNYGTYSYGYGGTNSYGVYANCGGATTNWALYAVGASYTTAGAWTTSDKRLKINIEDYNNAIGKIKLLPVKTYLFNTEKYSTLNFSDKKQYGIMAQDLEEIFPEMVLTSEHEIPSEIGDTSNEKINIKAVNYDQLIPVLIKGMQEQQEMIEELKAEVEKLKNKE